MPDVVIRRAAKEDAPIVLSLIRALAEYEKLVPPDQAARERFTAEMNAERPRFEVYLAEYQEMAVGYAIVFETYGSFQARPKLYIEDLFVLTEYRRLGIGKALFQALIVAGRERGCGAVEWAALDWNINAHRFYQQMGGRHQEQWQLFRLEL
ncbi:MAG: GNAT family N-acetyltransferase [Dehalogenimonas sp.]|jgi:GNAT superfamily N-acetyltransferase|uniref:GNAT family N-acetyltransferase n=1 Tax=Candidatus Dehalogenimonas loeffleri TaxID=3127115 RepID=A0ABZ2J5S5_9CHLR|nr:GNAT family N-acetyltransferase [Dehalogenimonas sp.]